MNLSYDFKFLEAYWQYIFAGVICYVSARMFYSLLGNKYREICENQEGLNDDYRTPDEGE